MASRWHPRDDERLRRWYPQGMPVNEIAHRFGRSPDAVGTRRRALGLVAHRPQRRRWSADQDALLRASVQAGVPAALLAERLGLPLEAVRRRRRALRPTVRPPARRYDAEQDAALRDAVSAGRSLRELAERLDRSEDALRLRARALGLLATGPRRRWTGREDELVREGYERGLGCDSVARDMLRGARTPGAVSARARKLGLATYARTWTGDEDRALRRLAASGASLQTAAERHGRTPAAIGKRARKLGIALSPEPATAGGQRWTAREDVVLRALAGLQPGRLARLLGRSDLAVQRRLKALGLTTGSPHRLPPRRDGATPGELRLIEREIGRGSRRILALARRLGRPPGELRRLARQPPNDREPAPQRERAARH